MCTLNIALLQIAPYGTLEGNLKKGIVSCRKAEALGADIALFPEMWGNGCGIFPVFDSASQLLYPFRLIYDGNSAFVIVILLPVPAPAWSGWRPSGW